VQLFFFAQVIAPQGIPYADYNKKKLFILSIILTAKFEVVKTLVPTVKSSKNSYLQLT
jgi:hypothetical protein